MLNELVPVVGTVVTVSINTEDEDLADALQEHGNSVLITSREDDMYWGEIITDNGRVDLEYHFEYMDITEVQYINDNFVPGERVHVEESVLEHVRALGGEWFESFIRSLSDKQLSRLNYLLLSNEYMEEI